MAHLHFTECEINSCAAVFHLARFSSHLAFPSHTHSHVHTHKPYENRITQLKISYLPTRPILFIMASIRGEGMDVVVMAWSAWPTFFFPIYISLCLHVAVRLSALCGGKETPISENLNVELLELSKSMTGDVSNFCHLTKFIPLSGQWQLVEALQPSHTQKRCSTKLQPQKLKAQKPVIYNDLLLPSCTLQAHDNNTWLLTFCS